MAIDIDYENLGKLMPIFSICISIEFQKLLRHFETETYSSLQSRTPKSLCLQPAFPTASFATGVTWHGVPHITPNTTTKNKIHTLVTGF